MVINTNYTNRRSAKLIENELTRMYSIRILSILKCYGFFKKLIEIICALRDKNFNKFISPSQTCRINSRHSYYL